MTYALPPPCVASGEGSCSDVTDALRLDTIHALLRRMA